MSKHTPGPWTLIGGKNGEWDIEAVGDHDASGGGAWAIAQTFGAVGYGEGNIESDANARLISSAPDLLAVVQEACAIFDMNYDADVEYYSDDLASDLWKDNIHEKLTAVLAKVMGAK